MGTQTKTALMQFHKVLQKSTQKDFKLLKVRLVSKEKTKDVPLFLWLQKKAVSAIATWPEWSATLNNKQNQNESNFKRYQQEKQPLSLQPDSLHQRYNETTKLILSETHKYVEKSIICSLKRFEEDNEYQKALQELKRHISIPKLRKIPQALPLLDIMSPSTTLAPDIIATINEKIQDRIQDLKKLPFPYKKGEYLSWNLAIILRVQAQLKINYSDRISRITAASENYFDQIFCKEILQHEVFSCIVQIINNNNTINKIAI